LLDNFEAHGSLPGNDRGIIVTVDVGEAFLLRDLVRVRFRFAEISPMQNDSRAEFLAIVYFHQRRKFRHHNCRWNTKQPALIRERLSMIASGGRDDTALLLVGGELSERITRAALLKTSRALQVVELAENFHARDFAEWDGGPTRRIINRISNALARRFDVLKSDHEVSSRLLPGQPPIEQSESGTGCSLHSPSRDGHRI
jgi:hypothetical protein